MNLVYIALGANLNDPKQQLRDACQALQGLASASGIEVASIYRSVPMGDVIQPDYLNTVARFTTSLSPLALLDALQQIEQQQGRQRSVRWGPRTLDLDILLYGNQELNSERLTIPHYGMKQRSFVLVPLFELAPELILPCQTPLTSLLTPQHWSALEKLD
ncbi:2-amino-4-hydroxy-6-hydroxymethyldihydropteridine diphosphokinase [Shewanella sp. NIFS-20-20]|uniref:2-amino-4-hydroxy-6- hydroxymethyldihydropteridine diphosphokinase n=1 Tax=Shewanella sp. NIFS-20-20 TaxID=2853806 RepID=UPI001C473282|nr:2-amino-4-hydroxy-6-hydroxymethyldihydropteridine diphosphokinase [Shewanella sp. NIFS-20-20]